MASNLPYLSSDIDFAQFSKHNSDRIVLLHFTAPWSAACKQMQTVLETLSKELNDKVVIAEVEAEALPDVAIKYNIKAVPTFIFVQDGSQIDRVDGAHAAEVTKKVRQHLTGGVVKMPPRQPAKQETQQDRNERLKALINRHPCMIFMKGSPDQPKCGFSRQLIDILNQLSADYSTFDILEDDTVRQGLKTYSDWPTYPQVYVKGELIGGLDIIKEMVESGELKQTIPCKQPLQDRLKSLINRAPLMVFMKGGKEAPRCKFSKTLMEILVEEMKLEFDTFDILEDEEVRQGLKEYSNWPTYPQVYVNGELIGGIDIVKEMKESGELKEALKID